jgi:hypothetical protein
LKGLGLVANNCADWSVVSIKQDNLSEAMGLSKVIFGDDAASFFSKFHRSGFQHAFEKSSGIATFGCSGAELALNINARIGDTRQPSEFRNMIGYDDVVGPVEYWIGYALGYLQGRSELSFSDIFKWFPLDKWESMYILHEIGDRALWDRTLGQYLGSDYMADNGT